MKKLALALVCLFSVAFFASCDPEDIENPEPTIAILAEEGYLVDGSVIDMNVEYPYGFVAASNPLTMKNLTRLVVVCGETTLCDTAISGTEFTYRGSIYFTNEDSRDLYDAEIIATVYDEAGKTNSASLKLQIDEESELEASPFQWIRANGADGTGLADFGLQWTKNVSSRFAAVIEPIPGERVTMYSVPAEKWDEVTTESQLEALFSDGGVAEVIQDYRGISVDATQEYDVVLATLYNGVYYLLHITKCTVEQRYYVFTIDGEWK